MPEPEPLALDGLRVLSFGAFVAGNTAALLLAELGADVVKIESLARPEVLRSAAYAIGPVGHEPSGATNTVMYSTLSRSVRGLALDLEHPQARDVLHRLVGVADAVVENFGGSTLAKWGCAYEDLLVDNPRLVMLSLSGYGRSGPRAGYLAYAQNISGFMGLTHALGYTHGTHSDYVTAATGALATAAAVQRARATGVGCHLDVAQIDAMVGLMAPLELEALDGGEPVAHLPNEVPGSWLSAVVPSLGHDRWLAVELEDAHDWSALCDVLERSDLDVAAVAGPADQASPAQRDELRSALAVWAAARTPHTAARVLQRAGLAAAAVQDSEDVWHDPQLRSRGFMVELDQPDLGPVTYPRSPTRMSRTPARIRRTGARVGEHSAEVLRAWIDVSDEELQRLQGSGACFDAGAPGPPTDP